MRAVFKQAALNYQAMAWTLDEYILKCFPNKPAQQKIAGKLAKCGYGTDINNPSSIKFKRPEFTSKEIADLIGKNPSDINDLTGIRRHLSEMSEYISTNSNYSIPTGIDALNHIPRGGRPPNKYFLNDKFWKGFNKREAESFFRIGFSPVDPNSKQHEIDDERVKHAKELAQKGDSTGIDQLICLLDNDSDRARLNASVALAELREPQAVDKLISMLDDESNSIRSGAVKALESIGDPRALDPLKNAADRDPDEFVRNFAMQALKKIQKD